MKQKSLLKTVLLLLCALVAGSGSAWAEEVTFSPADFSGQGTSGTGSTITATKNGVTFTCNKGYGVTEHSRCYSGSKITISSTNTITAISFTFTGNNYKGGLETSYTNLATTSWEKTLSSQARITSVVVTISSAPSVRTSISSLDFGTIKANDSNEKTFDITPLNLTNNLILTSTNSIYTVSVNTIPADASKTTVTVTASPTSINNNTAGQIIISCEDLEEDIEIDLSAIIERNDANISFDPVSITLTQGDELTSQPFKNPKNLTGITFISSYNNVASVSNSGVITLGNSTGTAIIKATIAQSDVYNAGEATCTITVNPAGVTPEPSAIGYYEKVTSADELVNGYYLIVYETGKVALNGNLESTAFDVEGNTVAFTFSNNIILSTENTRAAEFEIKSMTDGYSIQSKTHEYYITHTGSKNSLNTSETEKANTITFETNGDALIKNSVYRLAYNSNSDQRRFRYFNSTNQQTIQLYKYVEASNPDNIDIYVSAAGLATYASNFDLDYSNVTGLEAYIAKNGENSTITLEQVNKVPAGTGVLLRATAGGTSFNVPVASGTMDDVEGNLFVRGTGVAVASVVTVNSATKYNYILNVVNNKLGFYKANNQMVATNRAYLQTSVAAEARVDINFGENSGIVTVSREATANNRYYDLQGRSVMQPTKGLYIVNGKKVVVK